LNSFVISVFAIVVLSVLGILFKSNHPELVGGEEDPEDGPAVAATVFTAVIIYAVRHSTPAASHPDDGVADNPQENWEEDGADRPRFQGFLVFCGFQGLLHIRENRRGAIAL